MSHVVFSIFSHFKSLINDQRKCIQQFAIGSGVFLFGMLLILMGNYTLPASLVQEVVVLIGVLITGGGVFLFLTAHICFMISRFKHF